MTHKLLMARAVASGWTPANVTTQGWYDASSAASFTYSSGAVVSAWADLSGNGRTLLQATVANQPGRTGTQNGLATVVFDATNDVMQAAAATDWKFMHDGTPYVLGVVWRTVSSNPGALASVISTANVDAGNHGFQLAHDDRVSESRNDRLGLYVLKGAVPVSVDGVVGADNSFPAATFASLTALVDPDASPASDRAFLYTNGTLVSSAETSTATASTSTPSRPLQVCGSSSAGGGFTSIEMAELVIISGADATDANRVLLNSYQRSKWGI